jgi:hypothetical protein
MDATTIQSILSQVPNYESFLTVDELRASSHRLAGQHADVVEILPLGQSRQGDPIEALKIGNGAKSALIFAMPHPNEPIGSMMLEFFSQQLAKDEELRQSLDYTWYLIKCIDPDGTRLNEGWFKGPFSIANYGRHFYRPPSHQQIEWTFPVQYKSLEFADPMPETQALMALIEEVRPDFIYSLHNSGFGGAYFYVSEEAEALHQHFYDLVESQGLHLHLGEPEAVWMTKYADAIFLTPSLSQMYDFFEEQGIDPTKAITGGTSSFDYAQAFCDPFSLICEMPYFESSNIHDTTPSDMTRSEAILQGLARTKAGIDEIQELYDAVTDELTESSPFRDAVSSFLQVVPNYLAAQEKWAETDPSAQEQATIAEKLDATSVRRFYFVLLHLGMVIRMVETQIAAKGESAALTSTRQRAIAAFDQVAADLESELEYTVVPIRKLVGVQLGSALLAAAYAPGTSAEDGALPAL